MIQESSSAVLSHHDDCRMMCEKWSEISSVILSYMIFFLFSILTKRN